MKNFLSPHLPVTTAWAGLLVDLYQWYPVTIVTMYALAVVTNDLGWLRTKMSKTTRNVRSQPKCPIPTEMSDSNRNVRSQPKCPIPTDCNPVTVRQSALISSTLLSVYFLRLTIQSPDRMIMMMIMIVFWLGHQEPPTAEMAGLIDPAIGFLYSFQSQHQKQIFVGPFSFLEPLNIWPLTIQDLLTVALQVAQSRCPRSHRQNRNIKVDIWPLIFYLSSVYSATLYHFMAVSTLPIRPSIWECKLHSVA